MLLTHIADKCLIEIISRYFDGITYNRSAQGYDRHIGSTAANIHYHVSAGLGYIDTGSDRCRDRLLNDKHISRSALDGRILNCFTLNLGNSAGYADCDSGLTEISFAHSLLDEILHHLLGNGIIRDNTLAKRSDRYYISGSTAQHQSGVLTYSLYLMCITVESHNRGLFEYYALPSDINQYAGSS